MLQNISPHAAFGIFQIPCLVAEIWSYPVPVSGRHVGIWVLYIDIFGHIGI